MENSNPKIAVICMAYNAHHYVCEFLLHHAKLADQVYLIDHKSDYDLRLVDVPGVTVLRSNHVAQFQSECVNLVLDEFRMREEYDWLFVLDVDEFLPFSTRTEFEDWLALYSDHPVVHFKWRNGVPLFDDNHCAQDAKSLIDAPLYFFKNHCHNIKSFVNARVIGQTFFFLTGAHHISKPYRRVVDRLVNQGKPKIFNSVEADKTLNHVVAFDKDQFMRKIANYVEQMDMRSHVVGQGGWSVRDYLSDVNEDNWLWFIANFRITNPELYQDATKEDFVAEPIFASLNRDDVVRLREAVNSLPTVSPPQSTIAEKAYLEQKTNDTHVQANTRYFRLTDSNEIISIG